MCGVDGKAEIFVFLESFADAELIHDAFPSLEFVRSSSSHSNSTIYETP